MQMAYRYFQTHLKLNLGTILHNWKKLEQLSQRKLFLNKYPWLCLTLISNPWIITKSWCWVHPPPKVPEPLGAPNLGLDY